MQNGQGKHTFSFASDVLDFFHQKTSSNVSYNRKIQKAAQAPTCWPDFSRPSCENNKKLISEKSTEDIVLFSVWQIYNRALGFVVWFLLLVQEVLSSPLRTYVFKSRSMGEKMYIFAAVVLIIEYNLWKLSRNISQEFF